MIDRRPTPASGNVPVPDLAIPPVRAVPLLRPLAWLRSGWRDLCAAFLPSALHGVLVAVGGWMIIGLAMRYWYLLPGAVSGFVLVGPILATGLYELSRRRARGESVTLGDAVNAWRFGTRPLVWLGLVLALSGTLWVLLSAVLVALFVKVPITGVDDFLRHIVLSESSHLFEIWIVLGGLGAALVFAVTVVSAPLLLDRDIGLAAAVLTSIRAVGENPGAMALWATLIMIATGASMLTAMLGFVVAIPVIGHATWHAYRDVVDVEGFPERR